MIVSPCGEIVDVPTQEIADEPDDAFPRRAREPTGPPLTSLHRRRTIEAGMAVGRREIP